ncbi:G-protein coupled receptor GRL101-like protein [Trichoplax sp. H2]|nr:G-protein coupled receptor GRL101-like protein [Trichoplax sp. H2]|eukprot:RDD41382.1 G-protein coupled receptor GRL101-like protein [Trichoplax sp. H2]
MGDSKINNKYLTVLQGEIFSTIFCWMVGIIGCSANAYVIYATSKRLFSKLGNDMGRIHALLIGNLAIADICGGFYLIIIAIGDLHSRNQNSYHFENILCSNNSTCSPKIHNRWIFSVSCSVARFLGLFTLHLPAFLTLLMAIDRYFCIVKPYSTYQITLTKATIIVALLYVYALSIVILVMIRSENKLDPYETDSFFNLCLYTNFSDRLFIAVTYVGFGIYILSYCSSMIFYALIAASIRRSRRRFTTNAKPSLFRRINLEKRISLMTGILALANLLSWLPALVYTILELSNAPFTDTSIGDRLDIVVYLFLFINSAVNPIIYIIMTSQQLIQYCSSANARQDFRRSSKSNNQEAYAIPPYC